MMKGQLSFEPTSINIISISRKVPLFDTKLIAIALQYTLLLIMPLV